MPLIYNFHEVYEMGLQIERNGLAFYRHFAGVTENNSVKSLMLRLAEWEVKHEEQFKSLQEAESANNRSVSPVQNDSEAMDYLRSLADSHVFLRSFNLDEMANSLKSVKDILSMALKFEKDSVKLYESILQHIPENMGKGAVKRLAEEEAKHVEMITKELSII